MMFKLPILEVKTGNNWLLPECPDGCDCRLQSAELGEPVIMAYCPICENSHELYIYREVRKYLTGEEHTAMIEAECET